MLHLTTNGLDCCEATALNQIASKNSMKAAFCCGALLLLVLVPSCCQGGNILVIPTEGSHWINMEILLKALHSRGHNVTIACSSKSWYIKENSLYYSTFTVPMEKSLLDKDVLQKLLSEFIKFERGTLPITSFLQMTLGLFSKLVEVHSAVSALVPALLDDAELMRKLNETKFDLVLTDPCWGNGAILAKYMNLPLVYNVRWLMPEEAHFAIAPSPLSYIPVTGSGYTDKMTFFQRIKNKILYLITYLQSRFVTKQVYQPLCEKYLGPDCDFDLIKTDADIWLMRTDFVFDYPRPTMPNVVYMGGFHCKPAEPLPDHMEEFVQSSGEYGVIIMSLSTFVNQLPDDLADGIAAAFAKLPQKVIWSYRGTKPSTLGNNTLVVDWMPQKDLLGHPKIKLFVAHGGTNGVQEALCHGVPVVGFPLVFDQYDNLLRLQEKGGAKILTLNLMESGDYFLNALQEVLNEPSYRLNMQRLSSLHRDQPMKPIDTALFWIEYVMRHKGAAHLKAQSYRMPWYVYHSVDVALFLTGAVLLMLLAAVMFIRCLWKSVCGRKVKSD
ncbi:UDP-glucuronosyltransferase 2C1-like [Fundulus diaphanus]